MKISLWLDASHLLGKYSFELSVLFSSNPGISVFFFFMGAVLQHHCSEYETPVLVFYCHCNLLDTVICFWKLAWPLWLERVNYHPFCWIYFNAQLRNLEISHRKKYKCLKHTCFYKLHIKFNIGRKSMFLIKPRT